MKILTVSDIYGNVKIVEELVESLRDGFDVTIIAGGVGSNNKNQHYEKEVNEIFQLFSEISDKVLFVPGGTDKKDLDFEKENVINLDDRTYFLNQDVKVGFFGLGGIPLRSIKRKQQFPYRWGESVVFNNFFRKLKVNYEKLKIGKPDFSVLISHAPPFGVADYSKKISLSEFEVMKEMEEEDREDNKISTNPLHLGSRILKKFVREYPVNLHLFGLVHKQGGEKIISGNTTFLNVGHLSPEPYKLTGRKFLILNIDKEGITFSFKSLVDPDLSFKSFIEEYL